MDDRTETAESPLGQGTDAPTMVRAVVHIRSPLLDAPPPRTPRTGGGDRIPVGDVLRAVGPVVAAFVLFGGPFLVVAGGDWLIVAAVLAVVAVLLHRLALRLTFTLAEGFLGFRQAEAWPRGVQEEYDVVYARPSRSLSTGR
jgi:hypothetical protein